ncbi:MAG TPA: fluoride efflux transporter CrcB [Phaeodactylibacter sp.]|nr:fluoride efflux transporter CrcB [Phaeodactylibacter sp.]
MHQILYVFLGGGLGSLCRYGIGRLIPYTGSFYYGTFAANVLSSLLLGIIAGLLMKESIGNHARLFFITGLCGGFSTFSTFSAETLQLIESGNYFAAANYIFWSIFICILCIFIGMKWVG